MNNSLGCVCCKGTQVKCKCGKRTKFPKSLWITCPETPGPPGQGDCFLSGTHELVWNNPQANRCSPNLGWSWVSDTHIYSSSPAVDNFANFLGYYNVSNVHAVTTVTIGCPFNTLSIFNLVDHDPTYGQCTGNGAINTTICTNGTVEATSVVCNPLVATFPYAPTGGFVFGCGPCQDFVQIYCPTCTPMFPITYYGGPASVVITE